MPQRRIQLAVVGALGLWLTLGSSPEPLAFAEGALPVLDPVAVACEIKGSPALSKGTGLWSAPDTRIPNATFAGQPVGLVALGFPANAATGRIKVRTAGGVRIEGWLEPADLPLFAAVDLPVHPGHVWIAQGQRVSFSSASSSSATGALQLEATLSGAVAQVFRLHAACASLALDRGPRAAWDIPGSGRGYLPRHATLDLREKPGGAVIETLKIADAGSAMLLWSTESKDGFVHILFHEDLILDAWVQSAELSPLNTGETMDRVAPPSMAAGGAHLVMGGQPTIVRAVKEVPVRLSPQESARPVGVIESGSEVYVMETMLGWSSVLPRSLNVLPPAQRSFWVPSSEIGASVVAPRRTEN